MKILVTGGAGFIGSHLVERLLEAGYKVDNLDSFSDFYDPNIKRKNVRKASESSNYYLLEGDIRDKRYLDQVFEKTNYDLVIHLAAMAGVRPSIKEPVLYKEVNIDGTLNLLEECRKHNIRKFLFASSSSVYGNNKKLPFCETDNVDNPISPYATTKKAGELLCYTYNHLFNISVICLRFFTVYGARQRPDLAIHKFTRKIDAGEELVLFGDGSTSRDYTYIDDIIQGIMGAIKYLNSFNVYEIINLGESKTINLLEMVQIIEEEMGKECKYHFSEMQPGDVNITYADISKAKKLLNYYPQTEFREGIKQFIRWFNDNK